MRASVIICTYNRSDLLRDSIASVQDQDFPTEQFEIVVVDNNSTDGTLNVVREMAAASPAKIKYIFESNQGLSYARNTGIEHASGEIIVFIDDDIEADSTWLREMIAAFDSPDVAAAGGPIRPLWLSERPDWLTDSMLEPLAISEFPSASASGEFNFPDVPFGANMAVRKHVFELVGLFPTDLGRKGNSLLSNEEIEIFQRIQLKGMKIRYADKGIIKHKINPKRLSKHWYYKRFYWQGHSDALLDSNLGKNIYGKLSVMAPQLIEWYRNYKKLVFCERCMFFLTKGYIHRILMPHNNIPSKTGWRSMRALAVLLTATAKVYTPDCHDELLLQKDAQIEAFVNSLCWRITAPFRAIKHTIDRLTT